MSSPQVPLNPRSAPCPRPKTNKPFRYTSQHRRKKKHATASLQQQQRASRHRRRHPALRLKGNSQHPNLPYFKSTRGIGSLHTVFDIYCTRHRHLLSLLLLLNFSRPPHLVHERDVPARVDAVEVLLQIVVRAVSICAPVNKIRNTEYGIRKTARNKTEREL